MIYRVSITIRGIVLEFKLKWVYLYTLFAQLMSTLLT